MTVSRHVFEHDEIQRYFLFVNGSSKALVIVLHGFSETPELALQRLNALRKLGFSLLLPKGTGEHLSWNAGHCCGEALAENVDDIGFLSSLTRQVLRDWFHDSIQAYLT